MARNLLEKRLSSEVSSNAEKPASKKKTTKPSKKKGLLSSRLDSENAYTETKKEKACMAMSKENTTSASTLSKFNQKDKAIKQNNNYTVDDVLNKEADKKRELEVVRVKTDAIKKLIKKVGIIAACIYVLLLIFGVVITDYTYDEKGNAVAMYMSFNDLKALDEYMLIVEQYSQMQELYKQTLDIDYEYYSNPDAVIALSTKYEGLLEEVSRLSIKTDSIVVATSYTQIKSMMLSWIKNDIALYLQNMSAAIAQNDTKKAQNASEDRKRMYNNYTIITNNIIAFGKQLKGANVNNISKWNPDDYANSLKGEK